MLKIRLSRAGKRNTPFFKVVLTEHTRSAKTGYKEILGFYDPMSKEFKIKDLEKVKKYISTGTQFSPKVEKLMKDNNITL
ncbi:MAG: 30S ribosomal protein S16 [Candidatus Gracilibacteria bacterium]